jgi:hypothetical protein
MIVTVYQVKLYNAVSGNLHSAYDVEAADPKTAASLAQDQLSLEYAAVPEFNPNQYHTVVTEAAPSGVVTAELVAARKAELANRGGVLAVNYEQQIADLQAQVRSLMDYLRSGVASPQPTAAPSSAPADLAHAPAPAAPVAAALPAQAPATGLVPPNAGAAVDPQAAARAAVEAQIAQLQAQREVIIGQTAWGQD